MSHVISLAQCVPMRPKTAPVFLEYIGIPLEHNGQFRQFLRYLKAISGGSKGAKEH